SIVIAAKNEAENITALVNSIYINKISREDFEVIVIDDNSDDKTFDVANALTEKFINLKLISPKNKIYPGKKGALAAGINECQFDYILITDADCVVSEKWIETFANEFSNGFDFVFGAAPLTNGLQNLNYFFDVDNNSQKRILSRGLLRNDSLN